MRARKRGETASIFVPSVPLLLAHASEMEVERDHVLGRTISDEDDIFAAEDDLLAQAQQAEGASGDEELRHVRGAGLARRRFDRVLYDGGEFGHEGEVHVGSEEEMDFLGIPGPARARPGARPAASTGRASARAGVRRRSAGAGAAARSSTHEQLAVMRRELNGLVAAWHHRTGQPHGVTHAALRKECGGPAAAAANAAQLRKRIDLLRDWATRG